MLVKLYALPAIEPALEAVCASGVRVVRVTPALSSALLAWVQERFPGWAAETGVALSHDPPTCFAAVSGDAPGRLEGFACYDATCPNFFGPMGVDAARRGRGVGRALALSVLHAQAAQGYAYAIIGGVGPAAFYERTAGATLIDGSDPGIYAR